MSELAEKLMAAEAELAVVVDLLRCREDVGADAELVRGIASIIGGVLTTVKDAADFAVRKKQ